MKTLTLWEPWATFMASGVKTVETRSWGTSVRGLVAIHAAKFTPVIYGPSLDDVDFHPAWRCRADGGEWLCDLLDRHGGVSRTLFLHPGCVVATGMLTGTARATKITFPDRLERGWELGRHGIDVSPWEARIVGDLHSSTTRHAFLFKDLEPVTVRCPNCLGIGRVDPSHVCPTCKGFRHCDPIPVRGRQGWWNWNPS